MNIDDYSLISSSGEFDYDYYLNEYNVENCDPIIHFLEIGASKGFNPSPNFNTLFYLQSTPELKDTGVNPFVHYLRYGRKENKICNYVGILNLENYDYFKGYDNFIFSSSKLNDEINQYYNQNYRNKFNYKKFQESLNEKKRFFNQKNIYYDFFVIPERSIICNKFLPFETSFFKRNLDLTNLTNLSRFLNENCYFKDDTRLNSDGAKIFSYKIINSIDNSLTENHFRQMLEINKLHKKVFKKNIKTEENNENNIIIEEVPINLYSTNITKNEKEIVYYKNEDSFSNTKVIIFHDNGIESIKQYLSYYFREIIFCDNQLNLENLSLLNDVDYIFEIISEKELEHYSNIPFNSRFKEIFNEDKSFDEVFFCNKSEDKIKDNINISVIIPVYNTMQYLDNCLNSVFSQNFDNYEVICINDGSTDESINILEKYMKITDNLRVFSVLNKGQGHARNFGLNLAQGDYIYFLDSDDWINKNTLKNLYYKAKLNELDLLFYQSINYLEKEDKFYETKLDNFDCLNEKFGEKIFFNHYDTKNFLFEIPVNPVAKLYKKSFLDKYNLRFPEGIYFEDNAFFYNVYFKCEKAGFLNEKLYNRRIREGSVTTMINESSFDIIDANNKIIETFVENEKYDYYKRDVINHCFENIYYFFNKFPLELKYKFYEYMKNSFVGFNLYKKDYIENLKTDFLDIFKLMLKNDNYLDFESEFKLKTSEYILYDGTNYQFKNIIECENTKDSNKKYKISVIIPVYNNEKIIHRTLLSIINQSLGIDNIEVLLIDDNSSDNTKIILDDYADNYESITAIHLTKCTGSAGTPRNIGIYEASADYIMFLDHDDFFELDALEFLYDKIIKNDVDLVYGVWSDIIKNERFDRIYYELDDGYFRNLNEYEKLIAHPAPSIWTKLFKKDLIIRNNILFPTILGEDAIFLSKFLINSNGILFFKDKIICFHDLSDQSTTNNVTFKYLTEGFISEIYMFNFYKNINKENFYKYRTEGIIDFFIGQFLISSLSKEEISKLFNLFRKFLELGKYYGAKPGYIINRFLYDIILSDDLIATINFKEMVKNNKI